MERSAARLLKIQWFNKKKRTTTKKFTHRSRGVYYIHFFRDSHAFWCVIKRVWSSLWLLQPRSLRSKPAFETKSNRFRLFSKLLFRYMVSPSDAKATLNTLRNRTRPQLCDHLSPLCFSNPPNSFLDRTKSSECWRICSAISSCSSGRQTDSHLQRSPALTVLWQNTRP